MKVAIETGGEYRYRCPCDANVSYLGIGLDFRIPAMCSEAVADRVSLSDIYHSARVALMPDDINAGLGSSGKIKFLQRAPVGIVPHR